MRAVGPNRGYPEEIEFIVIDVSIGLSLYEYSTFLKAQEIENEILANSG